MGRPIQEVKVYGVQDRRSTARATLPWIVRWSIDGRQRTKAFRTRSEAERYRSLLLTAVHNGNRFDQTTAEPASWQPALPDTNVITWVRRWLREQWTEWQPRTRTTAVESLTKFVMLATDVAPGRHEADLRRYLKSALRPDSDARDERWEKWLQDHSVLLRSIDREAVAEIDRQLGLRLDGTPSAATTANRTRIVCRACVTGAVYAGAIPGDPWPPRSLTRARRKVARRRRSVDPRRLPDPETMARAIEALRSHQPGSDNYRVMTAVAYYAGLRPSEVAMLRVGALELPSTGWGRLHVVEADISFDEPGEPKTGPRIVPIPPVLVVTLQKWIAEHGFIADTQLLFRTRTGSRPAQSNWGRAWHRALASIGHPPLRVYDCRHAAATTWLRSGLPLGETARRLGHSVDTLVSHYVGALQDEEDVGNAKIERFLDGGRDE
jgi:integrase